METPALGCFLLCSFGVRLRRKALGLEVPSGFGFAGLKTSLQQPRGGYRPAALRRAACPRAKSSANKSANASKCRCLHQLACPRPARLWEPLGLQPGLSGAEASAGAVMGTGGTVPAWVLPACPLPSLPRALHVCKWLLLLFQCQASPSPEAGSASPAWSLLQPGPFGLQGS